MIEVKFVGFPTVYDLIGTDHFHYNFSGQTLEDLITALFNEYGEIMKEALWDNRIDRLDPAVQIKISGKYVDTISLQNIELVQNDHVTFMKLLAGG